LERIPFDGNTHETACRLEHAIDDDLEVALTILLGNPQLDPSGREIPRPGAHLEQRVQAREQSHVSLSRLATNESGIIQGILISNSLQSLFGESLSLGQVVTSLGENQYNVNGMNVMLDDQLANDIIVERSDAEK